MNKYDRGFWEGFLLSELTRPLDDAGRTLAEDLFDGVVAMFVGLIVAGAILALFSRRLYLTP